MNDAEPTYIQHSALTSDLDLAEITARFWNEVRPMAPRNELHIVDPYLLDPGRRDPTTHAGNVASLLKVLLSEVNTVTLVHGKSRDGVREELERNLRFMTGNGAQIRFVRPPNFHHRWVVADRARLATMDLSFNQIGSTVGGVHLVTSEQDRRDFCAVLDTQDPIARSR